MRYWQPILFSQGHFSLALVAQWRMKPLRTGAVLILRSALGAWFSAPASITAQPLAYLQAVPAATGAATELHPPRHWWWEIGAIAPYARISHVASAFGEPARLARALGSTCRVLIPRLNSFWALATLPSGRLSFLRNNVFVVVGPTAPEALRLFALPNAGYRRWQGQRPLVRGTARNPNDHPHGGRTRAIRYPRTPWGHTAKCSRTPRLIPRYKSLVKRNRVVRFRPRPYWATTLRSEATEVTKESGADAL